MIILKETNFKIDNISLSLSEPGETITMSPLNKPYQLNIFSLNLIRYKSKFANYS